MSAIALLVAQPLPASAFALTGPWWHSEEHRSGCATATFGYPSSWLPCTIGVVFTSALNSHSGWQTTAWTAANQWFTYDYGANYQRTDYKYDMQSGINDVQIDAADLGGRNPNGSITLGITNWYYYLPNTMNNAVIKISTNSA